MAVGSLLVILIVFLSSAWAINETHSYSYSLAVGHGSGSSYQSKAEGVEGQITAIRLREYSQSSFIGGLQFQYDGIWSAPVGHVSGTTIEMELRTGEFVTQISGKWYSSYIYQLQFVTNRGRMLIAGQPNGYSFNFYSVHPDARLVLVSGRHNSAGITSIGAHWDVV